MKKMRVCYTKNLRSDMARCLLTEFTLPSVFVAESHPFSSVLLFGFSIGSFSTPPRRLENLLGLVLVNAALWSGSTKNQDVNTGSLARPFARSLALLTRSLTSLTPLLVGK